MRGVYDYLLEDYYDADRFDSVRDYLFPGASPEIKNKEVV